MGKFDGILICTDLDGTLLKRDKTVSSENISAIEYFKSQGGKFTFITGRMPYYAVDTYNMIQPNAPVGCVNGGALYDYEKQEYVWTQILQNSVSELIDCVDTKLPDIGIQVSTFRTAYFCKDNETLRRFRQITKLPYIVADYNKIEEPIAKILFGTSDEDKMMNLKAFLDGHPRAAEFSFIRSERSLYEILPKGIGKGTAITKLAAHLGIDINKTVAIGDYNNDISMFEAAGIGIAVANACPDALAAADLVTVSNEEHAIAKVIYDIECGNISL